MAIPNRKQIEIARAAFPGSDPTIQPLSSRGANGYPVRVTDGQDDYFLKIIDPDRQSSAEIDGEIRALQAVNSPHVIKLLRYGEVSVGGEKFVYLVFPFIAGRDLNEIIDAKRSSGGQFTNAELENYAIQIAEGIFDIWDQAECVHQDIKPKNIRVKDDGTCVILDLGIARFRYEPRHARGRGSYKYSSPEQIQWMLGQRPRITYLADQRSLATILYEMAAEYPFDDGATDKIIASSLPSRDIRAQNATVSENLERIILKSLSKNPSDRFVAGPRDMINVLRATGTTPPGNAIKFFYQQRHSSTSYGYLRAYYANAATRLYRPSAIIFSGAYLPGGEFMSELSPLLNEAILDPDTLPMQNPNSYYPRGIRSRSYFIPCPNPTYFVRHPAGAKELVEKVFAEEIALNSSLLITPYFYVSDIKNGWWDINQTLYELAPIVKSEIHSARPLYAGLALGKDIIRVKENADTILNDLLQVEGLDGCYLMFQSPKAESAASLSDATFLEALKVFIARIEQKMPVLLAHSDIEGIPLICSGLSAFATNPHPSARRFTEDRFNGDGDESGGGNQPKARYYVSGLMNFILKTGELDKIIGTPLQALITCDCPFCVNVGLFSGNPDWQNQLGPDALSQHYLYSIAKEVNIIAGQNSVQRLAHIKQRIEAAQQLYIALKAGGVAFETNSDDAFLSAWQHAFC